MATHQPKVGHPPEGSKLQSQNLDFKLDSQNQNKVTTAPTIPRMVTHKLEDGHPPYTGDLEVGI